MSETNLVNPDYYILQDKDKFYNWVYPTYEKTFYESHINAKNPDFIESSGQQFVKNFLVHSPYRAILLYHGLGVGKTCAAIVSAEEFIEQKHVLLFIPASLKQNWLKELPFCGDPIYDDKKEIFKNYTFINYNSSGIKNVYKANKGIINNFYLGSAVNYEKDKETGSGVITEILSGAFSDNKYEPEKIIVKDDDKTIELSIKDDKVLLDNKDNINPFDNKIVIFDEVHNFIVGIGNIIKKTNKSFIQQIKLRVYNDLKNAINCKIIMLSGTPIVNNVYEISYISNILNGANLIYKFQFLVLEGNVLKQIKQINSTLLNSVTYINYINSEFENNKLNIYITFNPDYFYNTNSYELKYNSDASLKMRLIEKCDDFTKHITLLLKSLKIKATFIHYKRSEMDTYYMPENSEFFMKRFLNKTYDVEYKINYFNKVKNINVLKSLLAGKISYLKGELPTKTIIETIHVNFGSQQEIKYYSARGNEIEMNRKNAGKSSTNDDIENLASLRSKSRQLCNVCLFLDDIEIGTEDYDEELEEEEEQEEKSEKSLKKIEKYEKVKKFLENFDINNLSGQRVFENNPEETEEQSLIRFNEDKEFNRNLVLEEINKYSAKFANMIKKLVECEKKDVEEGKVYYPKGKVIIYSDFRDLSSGGVSFIGELLKLETIDYIDFKERFIDNVDFMDSVFATESEKTQKKLANFDNDLREKLIKAVAQELDSENYSKVYYLWQTSNATSLIENYIAHTIYDSLENLGGELLRAMFITKSGSEGISFKAVRQVHIIEPFWQQTREVQVIGRAVRLGSHDSLEPYKRNVFVYKYLCVFSNPTKDSDALKSSDKNLTTDQYITAVSYRKQSIIKSFYNIIQEVSLDCPYNNENINCYSFNNIDYAKNKNKEAVFLNDSKSVLTTNTVDIEAKLIVYNNMEYIVHDGIVYDYEKYNLHKILIKIGTIEEDGDGNISLNITRAFSNKSTCYVEDSIDLPINKNMFDKQFYGTVNKGDYTRVMLPIMGGAATALDEIEEDLSDDEELGYIEEEEEEREREEGGEDITDMGEDLAPVDEECSVIKSEPLPYITIEVEDTYQMYKKNDYLCIYDSLSNEKILIGVIKEITTTYIDINNTKIPIINKDCSGEYIILYKVKSKSEFLNDLGSKLLQLYLCSESMDHIYTMYTRNDELKKLISIILERIEKRYSKNYEFAKSSSSSFCVDVSEETIDPDIIQQVIEMTEETLSEEPLISSSYTEDTGIDFSGVSQQSMIKMKMYKNSNEYKAFLEKYKEIISNFYELLKIIAHTKLPKDIDISIEFYKRIIKQIKANIAKESIVERYMKAIKFFMIVVCSLIPLEDNEGDVTTYHSYSDITFLVNTNKPSKKNVLYDSLMSCNKEQFIKIIDSINKLNDLNVSDEDISQWDIGDKLLYDSLEVEVIDKHFDDHPPYYTIKLPSGAEKQTVFEKLKKIVPKEESEPSETSSTETSKTPETETSDEETPDVNINEKCNIIYTNLDNYIESLKHYKKYILLYTTYGEILKNIACIKYYIKYRIVDETEEELEKLFLDTMIKGELKDYISKKETELINLITTQESKKPADVEPIPVVVDEPIPVVVDEPTPVVVDEPTPVVVDEPTPVVVDEPTPVVVDEPTPVVVEEEPTSVVVEEPRKEIAVLDKVLTKAHKLKEKVIVFMTNNLPYLRTNGLDDIKTEQLKILIKDNVNIEEWLESTDSISVIEEDIETIAESYLDESAKNGIKDSLRTIIKLAKKK